MWDIVVVGSGPAGLSAAMNAAVRRKKVLLVGATESSNKVLKAEKMENYLGLPSVTGPEMAEAFLQHVKQFDVEFCQDHVETIYNMGDYYALQLRSSEEFLEAKAVILATGVGVSKLLENEEKFLGQGVGYCATCDAALYKGKRVVVIGMNEEAVEDTKLISEYAAQTTFVNRTGRPVELPEHIEVVAGSPKGFEGDTHATALILRDGRIEADGFFIIRDAKNADQILADLVVDGAHVPVDRSMKTNLDGVYAAGDITGAPYQVAKAVGEGQIAALAAARYVGSR